MCSSKILMEFLQQDRNLWLKWIRNRQIWKSWLWWSHSSKMDGWLWMPAYIGGKVWRISLRKWSYCWGQTAARLVW